MLALRLEGEDELVDELSLDDDTLDDELTDEELTEEL